MKIIYQCYTGSHLAIACAALHLGWLAPGAHPAESSLASLPGFDAWVPAECGRITYLGTDASGHEVYAMGVRGYGDVATRALAGIAAAYGLDSSAFMFVDAWERAGTMLKLGALLSGLAILRPAGCFLLRRGIARSCGVWVSLVEAVKRQSDLLSAKVAE